MHMRCGAAIGVGYFHTFRTEAFIQALHSNENRTSHTIRVEEEAGYSSVVQHILPSSMSMTWAISAMSFLICYAW